MTANGEVQTNEEAQVYVHDLDLFVTVQLLEGTPAVLSLWKLCEDHGYSYEWVSGQKPRLTKQEKNIICKTDNFVLLVVPGLSSSSGASSYSTSPPQDSSSTPFSTTSSPAQERSDEAASPKRSKLRYLIANQKLQGLSVEDALAKQYLEQKNWWLDDYWSQSP